jgi:acyl-CoA thioester hydrolase
MTKYQPQRSDYHYFEPVDTRWGDNDIYGHVNNVVYYAYFDTVVNRLLLNNGWLDLQGKGAIGLVVETSCQYFSSVAFPERLVVGLCVERLGNTSVVYDLAIFSEHSEVASAKGRFVHVYVDRASRQPTPLPKALRIGLTAFLRIC